MLPGPGSVVIELRVQVEDVIGALEAGGTLGKLVPGTAADKPPTVLLGVDVGPIIPLLLDINIGDTPPDDGGSGL